MWHGIIVDASLKDPARVALFTAFAKKVDDDWTIVGIEVEDSKLDESLMMIQHEMRDDVPFYSHLYNESELIVLFKNKLFRATIHSGSWGPITEYGEKLGISREQLDFVPRSFTHSATLLFFTFSRKLTTDHSDTLYGELEPGSGDGGIVSRLCQSPSNILLLHLSKANKSANSMPNPRKFFEAHSIIMVSFRTEEGLPFLPLRYINQVFLSAPFNQWPWG